MMTGPELGARRPSRIERRGVIYLGAAVAATACAGFIAPVLAYVVLIGAAVGSWTTRQQPVVRWTLTLLALGLVIALLLGLSGGPQHGSTGGPITHRP